MKLSALIIEPSRTNRSYLWQAMLAETNFDKVRAIQDLDSALVHLQSGAVYDVVLTSSELSREKIGSFVARAKESLGGIESAYITVVRKTGQTRENIAFSIVEGTDGFLFVPFSVHSLHEVAEIASRVKKQHERKRRIAALQLLLIEVKGAFSRLVAAMHYEEETSVHRHDLQRISEPLAKIKEEDQALYFEIIVPYLEAAEPFQDVVYAGASARIRKKLKKQIAAKRAMEGDSRKTPLVPHEKPKAEEPKPAVENSAKEEASDEPATVTTAH